MTILQNQLIARYFQLLGHEREMPEDGYHGQDIVELAKQLVEEHGDSLTNQEENERLKLFRKFGLERLLERIKQDLEDYRVVFDSWFSETSLYEDGRVEEAVQVLREKGFVYEKDGAVWFKSTEFGDDKDRVLVKQDGSFTYLTPDIAYHKNKIDRGFNELINIWGADHTVTFHECMLLSKL